VKRGTMGVNSLPKTVTRQRRDCDLNLLPRRRVEGECKGKGGNGRKGEGEREGSEGKDLSDERQTACNATDGAAVN